MRILSIIKRICIQMLRDKRTLALLFLAPLLVLTLMYFIFNSDSKELELGVHNLDQATVKSLKSMDIHVKQYDHLTADSILDKDLDGILVQEDGSTKLILQNSDPSSAKGLEMKIKQAFLFHIKGHQSLQEEQPIVETDYIYGDKDSNFFDLLSPILIAFFVFFFVFLISGIALLRERTTGTLERLMATPIRRGEMIAGYLLGYGLFAVIQTIIVVFFSVHVLDIVLEGSIVHVILVNLIVAFVALSLGILLSTFASSEFQMMQFIPIVVIPQVFFAGILPLDGMADWLQQLGKLMPLYYAGDALKSIMYKGLDLKDIWGDIFALLLFAALFIVLNILALKKYRKG